MSSSLAQLAQKASAQEEQLQAHNKRYEAACIDTNNEASYEEEEVALAEWTRNRKTVLCPWVTEKADEKKYEFDITKADKFFDLLLQESRFKSRSIIGCHLPRSSRPSSGVSGIILNHITLTIV